MTDDEVIEDVIDFETLTSLEQSVPVSWDHLKTDALAVWTVQRLADHLLAMIAEDPTVARLPVALAPTPLPTLLPPSDGDDRVVVLR